MKEKKPQLILYEAWGLMFDVLPDEKAGKLIKAIFAHVKGEQVAPIEGLEKVMSELFSVIDENMERYEQKREQLRANAKQKKANANQTQPNAEQMQDNNINIEHRTLNIEYKTLLSKESERDSGEPAPKKETPISKIVPPKIEWVKAYAESIGHPEIDCDYFFDHYVANEWTQGKGKKIKDWQAAFRNWVKRESEFNPKKTKDDEFMETIMNFGGDDIG